MEPVCTDYLKNKSFCRRTKNITIKMLLFYLEKNCFITHNFYYLYCDDKVIPFSTNSFYIKNHTLRGISATTTCIAAFFSTVLPTIEHTTLYHNLLLFV